MNNTTTLRYLIELYLKGKSINDPRYPGIIKDFISKTKQLPDMLAKLSLIYSNIGPCTIITYNIYYDTTRNMFPDKHVDERIIRQLLFKINDIQIFKDGGPDLTI